MKVPLFLVMADGREDHSAAYDGNIVCATLDEAEANESLIDYVVKYNVGEDDVWPTHQDFDQWRAFRDAEWVLSNLNQYRCDIPYLVKRELDLPDELFE